MGYRKKSIGDQYLEDHPNAVPSYVPDTPPPLPSGPINLNVPSPLDPMPVTPMPVTSMQSMPQGVQPQPQPQPQAPVGIQPEFIAPSPQQSTPMAAPQGPMMIPTFEKTASTFIDNSTSGVDAKSAAAIRAASAEQQKAVMDLSQVEAQKAQQQSLSKEEQAAIQGTQIDAEKAAREEQRAKELNAQKEMDKTANDLLATEFDQNRVWKRMGTGGSIAAGVGIALGALAQGFGAKSNAALDVIGKQVERDIEQQRMEYEKIKDKAKAQDSAYGRLRQLGMDDNQARAQLNKATLDQIQTKLEVGLAKLGVQEAPLKAAEATANARLKEEYALKKTEVKSVKKQTNETQGMKIGGGAPLNQKEQVELAQMADKDEAMKNFRNAKTGLQKFQGTLDSKGRANPVALAEYISGITGLAQGSYNPDTFNKAMQSAGFSGRTKEALRDFWNDKKPVPKDITDNVLATFNSNVRQFEPAARRRYSEVYASKGFSPQSVLGEDLEIITPPPRGNL